MTTAAAVRPLVRSLDPLPGESLAGYLLRLADRQDRTVSAVALRVGLRDEQGRAPAGLVLGLDPEQRASLAAACRLTEDEARALTLEGRVGTLLAQQGRKRNDSLMQAATAAWISPGRTRFCPDCLRGDAAGPGYWRLSWQLPWHYACLRHQRLLHDMCPICGNPVGQATEDGPFGALVPNPGVPGLPLDACRHRFADEPVCGHPLAGPDPYGPPPPGDDALTAQTRLDDLLGLERPPDPDAVPLIAGQQVDLGLWITALHGVVVLVRGSLGVPGGPDLGPAVLSLATFLGRTSVPADEVRRHLHTNTPPDTAVVASALVPAALHVLDAGSHAELTQRLAPYREQVREHRPGLWKSWLRQYPDARIKALLKTHARWTGLAAAARTAAPSGLKGRHLPQRVPAPHDALLAPYAHLAVTDTGLHMVTTVLLWQRAEPGSSRADAADALGFPEPDTVNSAVARLQHLLTAAGLADAYAATLDDVAAALADGPLVDYVARRAALAGWTVPDDDWAALKADLMPLQKRDGRQPDWNLRRLVVGQIVWEDLTGSDPFLSPAFHDLTDGKSRTRLRFATQQLRDNIRDNKVDGGPVIDAYRDEVLRKVV